MFQAASKPVPIPDTVSATFFDGARDGKLMLQLCARCGGWSFPVRERCPHCFAGGLGWRDAGGRGTLYTFAIMHQLMNPGFAASVPYNVSQIDLEEGVRMVSDVVGVTNEALRIGMRLEVCFEDVGDTVRIPQLGYATCTLGVNLNTARHPAVETGTKRSGEIAFRMAGITRDDIGTCQLYELLHLHRACDA
jgi:uncharacterized OB-fold protein